MRTDGRITIFLMYMNQIAILTLDINHHTPCHSLLYINHQKFNQKSEINYSTTTS